MLWENLREEEFDSAIERSGGLCVLPIGCLEKHGQHLPVGTDWTIAHGICAKAAEIEDAVVFPTGAWLGDVVAAHSDVDPKAVRKRGYIGLNPKTILIILEELCDEIHRNGFRKVLIVNSHGGNTSVLGYFLRALHYRNMEYAVLSTTVSSPKDIYAGAVLDAVAARPEEFPYITKEDVELLQKFAALQAEGKPDGHAGFRETALMMGLTPEYVRTERSLIENGESNHRSDYLSKAGLSTGVAWSANFLNAFHGYAPVGCTEQIGKAVVQICVERMCGIYKLLKEDEDCVRMAQKLSPVEE